MNKELKLQIPDSLLTILEQKARGQDVSLESYCLLVLKGDADGGNLVDPSLYSSLPNGMMRAEIQKVMESNLPIEEVRSRVRKLESFILRCTR